MQYFPLFEIKHHKQKCMQSRAIRVNQTHTNTTRTHTHTCNMYFQMAVYAFVSSYLVLSLGDEMIALYAF